MMAWLITLICVLGVISAILTIALNCLLIGRILLKKYELNKYLILFYYRFTLDIFFGISVAIYITHIQLSLQDPVLMSPYRNLLIPIGLTWFMLGAARSVISFFIALDRCLAAFFPIFYRNQRHRRVTRLVVVLVAAAFALFQPVMLFGVCDYEISVPEGCLMFGCAVNACFQAYRMPTNSIIFFVIVLLSALLTLKLCYWQIVKNTVTYDHGFYKANRLALLNTTTVILFDFLPVFCGAQWPATFSFKEVGPFVSTGKIMGCAVEALVVTSILRNAEILSNHQRAEISAKFHKTSGAASWPMKTSKKKMSEEPILY